jgi:hypothetical protein
MGVVYTLMGTGRPIYTYILRMPLVDALFKSFVKRVKREPRERLLVYTVCIIAQ